MSDPGVQAMFERNQIRNPHEDLPRPRQADHSIYWYNLHVVLVHADRFREVCEERIAAGRAMIVGVCRKRGYLLSRAALCRTTSTSRWEACRTSRPERLPSGS